MIKNNFHYVILINLNFFTKANYKKKINNSIKYDRYLLSNVSILILIYWFNDLIYWFYIIQIFIKLTVKWKKYKLDITIEINYS